MWRINDLYGVNAAHPAEQLSVIALKHLSWIVARYEAVLETNRAILVEFLESRPELQVAKQPYGTVLFPRLRKGSVDSLCQVLRDQYDTSVVPGSFFEAPEHFRIFAGAETAELKEALNRLAHSLTNKLIHTPSTQIRAAAENERHDLIAAAREIFKLTKSQ